jgi:hypothetical protein
MRRRCATCFSGLRPIKKLRYSADVMRLLWKQQRGPKTLAQAHAKEAAIDTKITEGGYDAGILVCVGGVSVPATV